MATTVIQAKELIPAQTGAATAVVVIATLEHIPTTFSAAGLAGAEVIPIEFSQDGGLTWTPLALNGNAVELTALNNMVTVDAYGQFRVNKGVTAGAVSVAAHTSCNP